MAVDDYEENSLGPICCKSEGDTTFVNYKNGVGEFVLSEWIDRLGAPFRYTSRFETDSMTVNELRILKLWERSSPLYSMT